MTGDGRAYDDLKLHLRVLGDDHELTARARIGPTKVMELLPLARQISEGITGIALASTGAAGEQVTCAKGCGACCQQLVPIAPLEAVRLAQVVEAMPRERRRKVKRRFERAVEAMEKAGLVDPKAGPGRSALLSAAPTASGRWEDASRRYFRLQTPCPFLEDGACSIYEERPMVCREYHVVTPASLCATLDPGIRATPRPVRMSEVMADFTNGLLGRDELAIPLTLALEWASAHHGAFEGEGDGEGMAMALVRCIQEADDTESGGAG